MHEQTDYPAVPKPILRKLAQIRCRKWRISCAIAAVVGLMLLLAMMACAMTIDWFTTLYDSWVRIVLTSVTLAITVLSIIGWLGFAWRRLLRIDQLAREVDLNAPELEERWTTLVRLGRDAQNPQIVDGAMLQRIAGESAKSEPQVDPNRIVTATILRGPLIALACLILVLLLAACLDPRQSLVLFERFWRPTATISATQFNKLPGDLVVGRGESLDLAASTTGKPVQQAALFLRPSNKATECIPLDPSEGETPTFSHRLRSVDAPFEYRFRAGDGQSEWFQVDVADRPDIKSLRLTITAPKYAKRDPFTCDALPTELTALSGSELDLKIQPNGEVQSVLLRFADGEVALGERAADGFYHWKTTLEKSFSFSPILTEARGLTNRLPPACSITVVPDQPPIVKITSPDDSIAVSPSDTIHIAFSATDDIGIGEAELVIYDESQPGSPSLLEKLPISLGDQYGARFVQQAVDLNLAKFNVTDGTALSYEVVVRETRSASDSSRSASPSGKEQALQATASTSQSSTTADTKANRQPALAPLLPSPDRLSIASSDRVIPPASTLDTTERITAGTQTNPPQSRSQTNAMPTALAGPSALALSSSQTARETTQSATATVLPADTTKQPASSPNVAGLAQQLPFAGKTTEKALSLPKLEIPLPRTAASSPPPASVGNTPSKLNDTDTPPVATSKPAEPVSRRETTSERKTLTTASSPTKSPNSATSAQSNEQQPNAALQSASATQSPPKSDFQSSAGSTPISSDNMQRRTLDVAQESSSNRMQLKVDKWAGSFAGQQRAKLEIAIDPALRALDFQLQSAQEKTSSVIDDPNSAAAWNETHSHQVTSAERFTTEAQKVIQRLQVETQDTPYAFIGLQVTDIGQAHVEPARRDLWSTLQADGNDRITFLRDTLQHLSRARDLVAELRGQFERTRRDFGLANVVEKAKKAYLVYVENSHALLEIQDTDPARYNRKLAEFDLNEEYLDRLREVLAQRTELEAELARVLAEDPRLLRRFMDLLRHRSLNLREELAGLVADQKTLNQEILAWTAVDEKNRPSFAAVLMLQQVSRSDAIARSVGEIQSRYQAWLPLNVAGTENGVVETSQAVDAATTAATELRTLAQQYVSLMQTQQQISTEPNAPTIAESAPTVDQLITAGEQLYDQLAKLQFTFKELAGRNSQPDVATFAANRYVETTRIVTSTSAWVRQMRAYKAGNYAGAAEIDQYRLATRTDDLAAKLGNIEQMLASSMERFDGQLPEALAAKARQFLEDLDKQATPNQLAAVYAIHRNELQQATERQKSAGDALTAAETHYDELMKLTIAEMDKIPVDDPINSVQNDPTLDELLSALEQEFPIAELLGIPNRSSNLKIIKDWLQPKRGSGGGAMASNQLRFEHEETEQKLKRTYDRAIARALKTAEPKPRERALPTTAKLSDWNQLVSHLGDDLRQGRDKAPPEQYRRAIEQYFSEISKLVTEKDQPPQR